MEMEMEKCIKNVIRGSALLFYHMLYPQDEFISTLVNQSISFTPHKNDRRQKTDLKQKAYSTCYSAIIKNNKIDVIYEIIPNMRTTEMQALAKVAVDEHNKEIIELLYKNELNTGFHVRYENSSYFRCFITYAYDKHGFEFVKYMNDIGFNINQNIGLIDRVIDNNDKDAANYIIDIADNVDELFLRCISREKDPKLILEFFIDKIDIDKHKDDILYALCYAPLSSLQWFLDCGVSIDSNAPLKMACELGSMKHIEFYLQYGLQVDGDILKEVFFHYCESRKAILNLFLKYNFDFSMLKLDNKIDYEFLEILENNGINKDALLSKFIES